MVRGQTASHLIKRNPLKSPKVDPFCCYNCFYMTCVYTAPLFYPGESNYQS